MASKEAALPLPALESACEGSALYAWAHGRPTVDEFAQVIYLCPTNVCNHRCITCASPYVLRKGRRADGSKQRGFMDWDLFERVVDQLPPGKRRLYLQKTGEPLMHPRIFDMMAHLKRERPDYELALHTNASRLTPEATEAVLKHTDFFSISVFGFDAETYRAVHGRDHYGRFLENVAAFHEAYVGATRRPKVYFDVVLNEHIAHMTPDDIAGELQARFPAFNVGVHFPFNFQGFVPGLDNGVFDQLSPDRYPVCIFPWVMAVVHWDGRVGYCVGDALEHAELGHVDEASLTEIWNSAPYQRFRALHAARDWEALAKLDIHCGRCNWLFSFKSQSAQNVCLVGQRTWASPDETFPNGIVVGADAHQRAGLLNYLRGEVAEGLKSFTMAELCAEDDAARASARRWQGELRTVLERRAYQSEWERALGADGLSLSTVHVSKYAISALQNDLVAPNHASLDGGLSVKRAGL